MSQVNSTFQVFTIHDPRKPDDKSCVYVGITQREDVAQCITSIVKKQFAELLAELEQEPLSEHQQIDVRLHGKPREQVAASDLKFELVRTSRKAGCVMQLGRKAKPSPFRITLIPDAIAGAEY
jgi:hypothetical protein